MLQPTPLVSADRLRSYFDREARTWGHLVKARRQDLGFTLDVVAKLADTTPQTVQKVESGAIQARDHLRVGLAFALQTEVDRLFPMPQRKTVLAELAAAVAS